MVIGRNPPNQLLKEYPAQLKFIKSDLSLVKNSIETAQQLKNDHFDVILFTVGFTAPNFERVAISLFFVTQIKSFFRFLNMMNYLSLAVSIRKELK